LPFQYNPGNEEYVFRGDQEVVLMESTILIMTIAEKYQKGPYQRIDAPTEDAQA